MATAELTMPDEAAVRHRLLLTAADLEHFPREVPSGPVDYELENGVLVMMMRPSGRHAGLQGKIAGELYGQGQQLGYGRMYTEPGLVLWRNPDRVVGPDVAFYARSVFPIMETPEGYFETMPSLAVEVRSKNDSRPFVDRKANDYLKAGVQLVWIVDADDRTVTILRPNQPPEILTEAQTLTAEEIIPGFKLSLADLFRE